MDMAGHHKGLTIGTVGWMLFSMAEKMSWFSFARSIARVLLQFRETRRKFILYTIVSLLVVFAIGNWPLAGWPFAFSFTGVAAPFWRSSSSFWGSTIFWPL